MTVLFVLSVIVHAYISIWHAITKSKTLHVSIRAPVFNGIISIIMQYQRYCNIKDNADATYLVNYN